MSKFHVHGARQVAMEVIRDSNIALFSRQVVAIANSSKYTPGALQASCYELKAHGIIKAKTHKIPGMRRSAALFYMRNEQLPEQSLPPAKIVSNPRRSNGKHRHASPDLLIAIPVGKTETTCVTIPQARAIFKQLGQLFNER